MLNLFKEVQVEQQQLQSMIKFTIQKKDEKILEEKADALEDALEDYHVTKRVSGFFKKDIRRLQRTEEFKELASWFEDNMPAVPNEKYDGGLKWHGDFQNLVWDVEDIQHRISEAFESAAHGETGTIKELEIDNKQLMELDKELKKLQLHTKMLL